jgi:hypothetical protein
MGKGKTMILNGPDTKIKINDETKDIINNIMNREIGPYESNPLPKCPSHEEASCEEEKATKNDNTCI